MLLHLALLIPSTALAADRFVEMSGVDTSNSCDVSDSPCGTLAQAVLSADAGDRIVLGSGTFSSSASYPIQVNGLILEGQGKDLTKLDGGAYGPALLASASGEVSLVVHGMAIEAGYGAIEVHGDTFGASVSLSSVVAKAWISDVIELDFEYGGNATLNDLDVEMELYGNGIRLRGDDAAATLTNAIISAETAVSVEAWYGSAEMEISNAMIMGSSTALKARGTAGFEDLAYLGISASEVSFAGPRGIHVSGDAEVQLGVQNGLFSGNSDAALDVSVPDSADLLLFLVNNTIVDGGKGVSVEFAHGGGGGIFAQSNYIAGHEGNGLEVGFDGQNNDVEFLLLNNAFIDNRNGVAIDSESENTYGILLADNLVEGNSSTGVRLEGYYGAIEAELTRNVVIDNAVGVAFNVSAGTFSGTLRLNTILDNSEVDLSAGGTNSSLDATNNWWGAESSSGIADLIYDATDGESEVHVDHSNFLSHTLEFTISEDASDISGGETITIDRVDETPPFTATVGANGWSFDEDDELVEHIGTLEPQVWFGDVPAWELTWISEDQFEVVVPPVLDAGSVDITVVNPGGQWGILEAGFEYKIDSDADGYFDDEDNCPDVHDPTQLNTDEADDGGDVCDDNDDDDDYNDDVDNCPLDVNDDQDDNDDDGFGDVCDWDDDNDGTADEADLCPVDWDDQTDTDDDQDGDACDDDDDDDDVDDVDDNCPWDANTDQEDNDGDDFGDVCDWDDDNDGAADGEDLCPSDFDDQADNDEDGDGDACDDDDDNDGDDDVDDNCPWDANADQADEDEDGQGDVCDPDYGFVWDTDGDGVLDTTDNCLDDANSDQANTDAEDDGGDACDDDDDDDGVGDEADNCPWDANADQADVDGDDEGDVCDADFGQLTDVDGDGVLDGTDNCEDVANADQLDHDGDGSGDVCDDDDDADGVDDDDDNCPWTENAGQDDVDGDGTGDACDPDFGLVLDTDEDGVLDTVDNCTDDANPDQINTDGDDTGDACDADDDNDGLTDDADNCPLVANADQADGDDDGIGNACDDDLDADGIADTGDNCPELANEDQADVDGDGFGDACDLEDGSAGVAGADDTDGSSAAAECSCASSTTPSTGFAGLILGALALVRRRRD
jgi:MYXO-CTERM domain-containing protein